MASEASSSAFVDHEDQNAFLFEETRPQRDWTKVGEGTAILGARVIDVAARALGRDASALTASLEARRVRRDAILTHGLVNR